MCLAVVVRLRRGVNVNIGPDVREARLRADERVKCI